MAGRRSPDGRAHPPLVLPCGTMVLNRSGHYPYQHDACQPVTRPRLCLSQRTVQSSQRLPEEDSLWRLRPQQGSINKCPYVERLAGGTQAAAQMPPWWHPAWHCGCCGGMEAAADHRRACMHAAGASWQLRGVVEEYLGDAWAVEEAI